MKKNKKIILIALSLCLLFVGSISAFLVVKNNKTNTITIGAVNSKIVEDFNPPSELKPGISFKKKVAVKNLGPNDCYVRVLVGFSDSEMENLCSVDYNDKDWTYNYDDGYWYYNSSIKKGETTSNLFNKVTISDSCNENDLKNFDITIYHETSNKKFN